jgi:hypothetical protein
MTAVLLENIEIKKVGNNLLVVPFCIRNDREVIHY